MNPVKAKYGGRNVYRRLADETIVQRKRQVKTRKRFCAHSACDQAGEISCKAEKGSW